MSRLIVLSNRVKLPDNGPMAGGLAVALQNLPIGESGIWMGWNGDITDSDESSHSAARHNETANNEFSSRKYPILSSADGPGTNKITYVTTALTAPQYQHYYCGFANNVLWPLLHEQPEWISQASEDYAGYQAVNRLFAQQLKNVVEPDDVIWVHDYHFLSVAYYCRKLGLRNQIGFFLHIPFAPISFWQPLEQSAELITHLAHYDVIGTQTEPDKTHCLTVFKHYLKDRLLKDNIKDTSINCSSTRQTDANLSRSDGVSLLLDLESYPSHTVMINDYPIGVNASKIQQQVSHLSSQSSALSARPTWKNHDIKPAAQQIIAVDRIDYSKGLLERFSAYRDFLQQNPAYQYQLNLLQIACPSRLDLPAYQQLYDKVKQAVNDVNQQFSPHEYANKRQIKVANSDILVDDANPWQPITYSESVLGHKKLMQAFWQSDIGWVNSLKDGMNLVAKEYIAAQNPVNPGVLLLSQYAGAAEQMQAAVIINPHEPTSIIAGLKTALTMPLAERKSRYQTLMQGLQDYDLRAWQQDFLDDLYAKKQ